MRETIVHLSNTRLLTTYWCHMHTLLITKTILFLVMHLPTQTLCQILVYAAAFAYHIALILNIYLPPSHSNTREYSTLLTIRKCTPEIFVLQYIPRNMHTVFALLCFVVVILWLIFPYPSGLLHWHCGNLTIAPVPAKQPWWIWINTSCEFIMNDCITTTKQSTTKPCAYFLGYTVLYGFMNRTANLISG